MLGIFVIKLVFADPSRVYAYEQLLMESKEENYKLNDDFIENNVSNYIKDHVSFFLYTR